MPEHDRDLVHVEIERPYSPAPYQNGKVRIGLTLGFDPASGPAAITKKARAFIRKQLDEVIAEEIRDFLKGD